MTTKTERLEQAAFHFRDGIFWVAYRYSGGDKEEVAYNAGWDFSKDVGDGRYSMIRKVLDAKFGVNSHEVTQYANGCIRFGGPFAGCSQVFIDISTEGGFQGFAEKDRAAFMEYFDHYGIKCIDVDAPWQSYKDINARWAGPMGLDEVVEPDGKMGGVRALSVMSAGITAPPRLWVQGEGQGGG